MSFVLIIALLVAVIALTIQVAQQSKTINKYEEELTKKARKSRKNVSKE